MCIVEPIFKIINKYFLRAYQEKFEWKPVLDTVLGPGFVEKEKKIPLIVQIYELRIKQKCS